jgi:hypothetical protein
MLGMSVQAKLARRLDDFAANSPLAADALEAPARRRYLVAWHLIAITAAIMAAMLSGHPRLAWALPAYVIGALLAMLWWAAPWPLFMPRTRPTLRATAPTALPELRSTWEAMALSVAKRQTGLSSDPIRLLMVLMAAALATTMIAAVAQHAARQSVAEAVFGIGAISLAAWLSRVDHGIVRFTAFAGQGAWASVAAHAATGAIGSLFLISSASVMSLRFAVIAFLIFGGALILLTLRVFAYRLYSKRQADLVLTLAFGAAVLIGSGALFLAPPMLVGLVLLLAWRARSATWLAP